MEKRRKIMIIGVGLIILLIGWVVLGGKTDSGAFGPSEPRRVAERFVELMNQGRFEDAAAMVRNEQVREDIIEIPQGVAVWAGLPRCTARAGIPVYRFDIFLPDDQGMRSGTLHMSREGGQ